MTETSTPSAPRIRSLIVSGAVQKATDDTVGSKTIDPFRSLGNGQYVTPPFDPVALARITDTNSQLRGFIESISTNTVGFGHRLLRRTKEVDEARFKQQEEVLRNFLVRCGMGRSFSELRGLVIRDRETTGNAYLEVLRTRRGSIGALKWIPSTEIRISPSDPAVEMQTPYVQIHNGQPEIEAFSEMRTLRRFVQGLSIGTGVEHTWFKTFGDPRVVHKDSGAFAKPDEVVPFDKAAGEVLWFPIPSLYSPCGIPRWVTAVISAMGARSAREVNFHTLENNDIPSLAIVVSGGRLTDGSMDRIEEYLTDAVQKKTNFSKFLLLEGESGMPSDESGNAKIHFEPLKSAQHDDQLFGKFLEETKRDVGAAFRISPIYVGETTGVTESAIEAIRRMTDEQVFAPERNENDSFWNEQVLPHLGLDSVVIVSQSPNVTDNRELVQMLATAERTGGVTPEISRRMIEEIYPQAAECAPMDTSIPQDVPFSITMAQMVKKQNDPTEVGQLAGPVQPPIDPIEAAQKAIEDDEEAAYMVLSTMVNRG